MEASGGLTVVDHDEVSAPTSNKRFNNVDAGAHIYHDNLD